MSPELITILAAMSPVLEVRASIPLAVAYFKLPPLEALYLSITGSVIVALLLAFFLPIMSNFLMQNSQFCKKTLTHVYESTQRRHGKLIENLEALGLFLIIAIPLPLTGVWTASALAFLFDIPKKKALIATILGAIAAAIVVFFFVEGISLAF
ncbi:MAG: small multi-drug export protein [Candidatus Paceibacterota bacterium]